MPPSAIDDLPLSSTIEDGISQPAGAFFMLAWSVPVSTMCRRVLMAVRDEEVGDYMNILSRYDELRGGVVGGQ